MKGPILPAPANRAVSDHAASQNSETPMWVYYRGALLLRTIGGGELQPEFSCRSKSVECRGAAGVKGLRFACPEIR